VLRTCSALFWLTEKGTGEGKEPRRDWRSREGGGGKVESGKGREEEVGMRP
jgi:hypothetical protein